MGSAVVAVEVALDLLSGLVEGVSNSVLQMSRSLSFENHDSMNAWDSGSR